MKKTLAILLVMVMGLGYAAESKADFKIGPRIGLNVNKMHFNRSLLDGSNRAGFTGGVQAEYMIPMLNFGFDLSLMYSYMDAKVEGDLTNTQYDLKSGKHFLEIPLNIKYKIGIPAIGRIMKPYVFTGPSVAFKLDGDSDAFKTTQWTWNLGAGLEFISHLQVGFSYGWGMNNIMDGVKVPVLGTQNTEDLKVHNNYWTVTAAWLF